MSPRCIHFRMTSVLTIRVPPLLLSQAEARAARLGLDRAKYVRGLIERDLAESAETRVHQFSSEDLAGVLKLGKGGSATNDRVRKQLRARQQAKAR